MTESNCVTDIAAQMSMLCRWHLLYFNHISNLMFNGIFLIALIALHTINITQMMMSPKDENVQ